MKKLFISFICTITFIPHLFGMELMPLENKSLKPKYFTYDALKLALIDYSSKNVHRYVKYGRESSTEASKIIVTISRINIDLYNELNNPIVARDIITNVKNHCCEEGNFSISFINNFRFPGVTQCRNLCEQLYDNNLTEDKLEELFKQGAIISFSVTQSYQYRSLKKHAPLQHWHDSLRLKELDEDQCKKIIKKLLDLTNIEGNACHILQYALEDIENRGIVEMILTYKPKITESDWYYARTNSQKHIDLLLSHANQDEIYLGLIECLTPNNPDLKLAQKFIDKGASPNDTLRYFMKSIQKQQILPFGANTKFIQIFNFLCNNKAFDKEGLALLQQIQETITSLINTLEENRPADIFEMEQ